jgi:hypothetical protein
MLKSQIVADLTLLLSGVTSVDRASAALQRAARRAGLSHAVTMDEGDLHHLLAALAAEGGPIQDIALQVAVQGMDGPPEGVPPTDRNAA